MNLYSLEHAILILETVIKNLRKFPGQTIPNPKEVSSYIVTLAVDLDECVGWEEEEGPQE